MNGSMCPIVATPFPEVNEALGGHTVILSPTEFRDLPPAIAARSSRRLTYRMDGSYGVLVEGFVMALYTVAGAPRLLTPIDAEQDASAGGAVVDVRLVPADTASREKLVNAEVHWVNLAGDGRYLAKLARPTPMRPGSRFSIEVTNNEAVTNVVVALHLVGRRIKTGARARSARERIRPARAEHELKLQQAPLVSDQWENLRRSGMPAVLGLDSDTNSPEGYLTCAAGNYDTPGAEVAGQITNSSELTFYADRVLGHIYDPAAGDFRESRRSSPVFVRLVDDITNQWVTEGWVPLGLIGGEIGDSAQLPAPLVIPRTGVIRVEARSLTGARRVAIGLAGRWRRADDNEEGWFAR